MQSATLAPTRHAEIKKLYTSPFLDLIYRAQGVHRQHHTPNAVQKSVLISIKTGGCKEDCAYCSQSAKYKTGLKATPLLPLDEVRRQAQAARDSGATRFCMGASGRRVSEGKELSRILEMVREVKDMGLESCATLGTVTLEQAKALKDAGLDYYNHNIDTSREYYEEIISTRTFAERMKTLHTVREAGLAMCTGGILGMGESMEDRIAFIGELTSFDPPPESLTVNRLVPIKGTPLENVPPIAGHEIIRTIATLRILAPRSAIRLSAGRETMSEDLQALAFLAGANSIFGGDKLLTTPSHGESRDAVLFEKLGLDPEPHPSATHVVEQTAQTVQSTNSD